MCIPGGCFIFAISMGQDPFRTLKSTWVNRGRGESWNRPSMLAPSAENGPALARYHLVLTLRLARGKL